VTRVHPNGVQRLRAGTAATLHMRLHFCQVLAVSVPRELHVKQSTCVCALAHLSTASLGEWRWSGALRARARSLLGVCALLRPPDRRHSGRFRKPCAVRHKRCGEWLSSLGRPPSPCCCVAPRARAARASRAASNSASRCSARTQSLHLACITTRFPFLNTQRALASGVFVSLLFEAPATGPADTCI
jgi:hypothetical protein